MFIELHLYDNNEKIIININRINSIYKTGETTYVYIGEVLYRVKESYDDIVKIIDKHYHIKVENEE